MMVLWLNVAFLTIAIHRLLWLIHIFLLLFRLWFWAISGHMTFLVTVVTCNRFVLSRSSSLSVVIFLIRLITISWYMSFYSTIVTCWNSFLTRFSAFLWHMAISTTVVTLDISWLFWLVTLRYNMSFFPTVIASYSSTILISFFLWLWTFSSNMTICTTVIALHWSISGSIWFNSSWLIAFTWNMSILSAIETCYFSWCSFFFWLCTIIWHMSFTLAVKTLNYFFLTLVVFTSPVFNIAIRNTLLFWIFGDFVLLLLCLLFFKNLGNSCLFISFRLGFICGFDLFFSSILNISFCMFSNFIIFIFNKFFFTLDFFINIVSMF